MLWGQRGSKNRSHFFKDAKSRPGCTNACARAARGRHGDLLIISITGFDFELDLGFYQIHLKIPSPLSIGNRAWSAVGKAAVGGFVMLVKSETQIT